VTSEPPLSFEDARERLRQKGYLDRGVEGAVLKGALAARTRARALLKAAFVATLFLALALAAAQAVMTSVASGLGFQDALVLFAWLFAGALAFGAAAVSCLMALAWLRGRSRGGGDHVTTEIGVAFGLVSGGFAALAAAPALEIAGTPGVAVLLAVVGLLVFLSVRVARSVTLTVLVASGRSVLERPGKTGALAAAGLAILAVAGAFFGAAGGRRSDDADEPLVVASGRARVVVIGVDGWSDRFLPAGAAGFGAAGTPYAKEQLDPAAVWTTVATGEGVSRHGVGSLDLVRVRGVGAPVKPDVGTTWYLRRLLPATGLARLESVTSASRRVPAVWDVASRAGIAALAVGWWTTYPATGPATVLSNHLFFAARSRAPLAGEGWPPEAAARAAGLVDRPAGLAAVQAGSVERLVQDASGLDAFTIAAFEQAWEKDRPRLALVYLPGLDILAAALSDPVRSAPERVALARALTVEADRVRTFATRPLPGGDADLRLLLLDGGRNERTGRLVASGPLAAQAPVSFRLVDLAPTVLAVLGIPASRACEGKVVPALVVPGAATTATVASWGRRHAAGPPPIDPKEYVDNLRSLGYLK
jgi:hypothetical protein